MLTALTQRGPTDGHWVQLALPHPSEAAWHERLRDAWQRSQTKETEMTMFLTAAATSTPGGALTGQFAVRGYPVPDMARHPGRASPPPSVAPHAPRLREGRPARGIPGVPAHRRAGRARHDRLAAQAVTGLARSSPERKGGYPSR